ncbi:hypothetical protein DFH11DRAFT_1688197 [Phellopilus nigrolimitatus]|nr:hypothetical protein DFH11DRAFT_1688197 [Phellopilus nigrolimitatus]
MSLSSSPPYRRLSTASTGSKREEDLINAYEAEEERIINVLSRKLEQLREEKISLERTHEEESEAHVNRLARELAILRLRQHQQAQAQAHANGNGVANGGGPSTLYVHAPNIVDPNTEVLLAALKKENESLRGRLVVAERDYVRVTRLNEIYREELIEHRRRLGLPVDNLIGLSSVADAYSQPTHRRTSSTASSSPTASMVALPTMQARPSSTTHSMPIPRQTSQVRRSHNTVPSISETPLSNSPSSAESPYLSPMMSTLPESFVSNATNLTTPPSSASLQSNPPAPYPLPPPSLSYPSVPPPSLSSSLGSPVPAGSLRDQRFGNERRVAESGNLRDLSLSRSRRTSIERGARVAETGSLVRSRAGSATAPPAVPTTTDLGVFVPSLDETLE